VLVRNELQGRRNTDLRLKLLGTTLNSYAFGLLGGAFGGPFLKQQSFGVANLLALCLGLVCHALALYLAPKGDRHEH